MSATCSACGKEMAPGNGCTATHYKNAAGVLHARVPYDDSERPCHDCNVTVGQFHHPGCDMERCPVCGRQLLMCGCDV